MTKNQYSHTGLKDAFTLIELVAVIGILCLLGSLVLPILARAKITSPGAGCLSTLRQMQLGANMYREDNNDFLIPNTFLQLGWVQQTESWGLSPANTNVTPYATSLLWPYVNGDISVYRCPADFKPSANGYRIRSRSMNGQMGVAPVSGFSYNPGWRVYQKGSDLTCPAPASAFVFCDESMYTLDDGYLQMSSSSTAFPDVPAAYHAGGCGFSFADGHAEIHRWQGSYLVNIPYAYDVVKSSTSGIPLTPNDPDWVWLVQHAACHN